MKYLLVVLSFSVLLVIYIGQSNWDKNIAEVNKTAILYKKENRDEENKRIEFAKTTWLGKVKPRVYVIGSSVAAGAGASDVEKTSWAGLLHTQFLKSNPDIYFKNLGVGGYSTKDILDNKILGNIINPDVVIFETCLLNNFTKYRVSESLSQIKNIYSEIHNTYPDAKIILMPSEPPVSVDDRVDEEGKTYREYVNIIGDFIMAEGWEYVDFWDKYEKSVEETGNTLSSVLKDSVHPNDKGYEIWFESIRSHFGIKEE